jgi:4-hydroxy-4-methyl-2-oxoglutarate aldolase
MAEWKSDDELCALILRELYTPVVGDILDQHGFEHQFLPQPIRPLRDDMRIVGRAMPVLMMDVYGPQDAPFGLMTQALDDLRPGEVYIASGASHRSANWGEIMTAAARARGAVGALVDGYHRDTPRVLEQDFPVFSRGHYGQDSGPRMKVAAFRTTIEIGGIRVRPGDLVFADIDGALVVPAELVETVVTGALEKARSEKTVRAEIENGMSVTEAFSRYWVL